MNTGLGDKLIVEQTDELLSEAPDVADYVPPERIRAAVQWESAKANPISGLPKEALIALTFFKPVKQVTWHGKGDYFATVLPEGLNRSVLIHQLSKWRSQVPFSKAKGLVQTVLFHPVRPYLLVATQRHVRIYNLSKLELTKKLQTGAKWISSMAIHPHGDNLLLGNSQRFVKYLFTLSQL